MCISLKPGYLKMNQQQLSLKSAVSTSIPVQTLNIVKKIQSKKLKTHKICFFLCLVNMVRGNQQVTFSVNNQKSKYSSFISQSQNPNGDSGLWYFQYCETKGLCNNYKTRKPSLLVRYYSAAET